MFIVAGIPLDLTGAVTNYLFCLSGGFLVELSSVSCTLYCTKLYLACQVDSWWNCHESECRLKSSFEDEIPLEAKEKSWTHKFVVVRDYLKHQCQGEESGGYRLVGW